MGGAGTEYDSHRARARRTTLQSCRIIGLERARFQYVGHCSQHGSCTLAPVSDYLLPFNDPMLSDRLQVNQEASKKKNRGGKGVMEAAAVDSVHKWSLLTATWSGWLWELLSKTRSSETEQFHLQTQRRTTLCLSSFVS